MSKPWLFIPIALSVLLLLAACNPAGNADSPTGSEAVPVETALAPAAPKAQGTSTEIAGQTTEATPCDDPFEGEQVRFSTEYWAKTNFCLHSVPYSEILSGGPPPDGIPAIDNPQFVTISEADEWLQDREPVIYLQENADIRAYPLQILTWHEIVNDTVGGRPVVVTFCPLCNTALVFERPMVDGERLTFGTSGNLRNSDLVMYDRQTESWWQQFSGEAIVGDLTGMQLTFLPAAILSWADFRTQYPNGQVLSRETGYNRRYGTNPYVGYDDVNQPPFLYDGPLDDRLRPMERVVGILQGESGVAYPLSRLQQEQVINDTLETMPIVVFWKPGTASALDAAEIAAGQDVGSSAVYRRTLEGQTLTFSPAEDGLFQDAETGSTWNFAGASVDGPLAGAQLIPVPHHDTFWFAWAAFVSPDSLLDAP